MRRTQAGSCEVEDPERRHAEIGEGDQGAVEHVHQQVVERPRALRGRAPQAGDQVLLQQADQQNSDRHARGGDEVPREGGQYRDPLGPEVTHGFRILRAIPRLPFRVLAATRADGRNQKGDRMGMSLRDQGTIVLLQGVSDTFARLACSNTA